MGIFSRPPALSSGERVRWKRPMGYSLPSVAIPGTMYLTDHDLLFVPARFSSHKSEARQRIAVRQVASVDIQPRTGTLYNGGLRRRVRIRLDNGDVHLFTSNHPDRVVRELQALLWP